MRDRETATDRGRFVEGRGRLRGRDAEIDEIRRRLDDVRAGRRAGVMTWSEIPVSARRRSSSKLPPRRRHAGIAVHRRTAEVTLAFAGLLQMMRPLLGLIGRLPGPHGGNPRRARPVGRSSRGSVLISVAVRNLLSEAAEGCRSCASSTRSGSSTTSRSDTLASTDATSQLGRGSLPGVRGCRFPWRPGGRRGHGDPGLRSECPWWKRRTSPPGCAGSASGPRVRGRDDVDRVSR